MKMVDGDRGYAGKLNERGMRGFPKVIKMSYLDLDIRYIVNYFCQNLSR